MNVGEIDHIIYVCFLNFISKYTLKFKFYFAVFFYCLTGQETSFNVTYYENMITKNLTYTNVVSNFGYYVDSN